MCDRRQYTQAWLTLRRFFLPLSLSPTSDSFRLGERWMLCGDWLVCCWPWARPCVFVESSSARIWSLAGEVMVELAQPVLAEDRRRDLRQAVGERDQRLLRVPQAGRPVRRVVEPRLRLHDARRVVGLRDRTDLDVDLGLAGGSGVGRGGGHGADARRARADSPSGDFR